MSSLTELVKKHAEEQERIGKDWSKARKEAKDKIHKDLNTKRDELKAQLNKLREEERQLSTNLLNSEKQSAQELAKITDKLSALELNSKGSIPEKEADIHKNIEQLRHQQLNQIWTQTLQDINSIIEKHKDCEKRMDQILTRKMIEEKSLLKTSDPSINLELNILKAEKAISEQRVKNCNEMFSGLERVRKDIDKKMKEIAELDQTEKDKFQRVEERTVTNEQKERKEGMDKFLSKVFALHKKQ